ncbi:MAG: hypothetical protein V1856_01980 [Candidatus Liptonbacteria bacterium]
MTNTTERWYFDFSKLTHNESISKKGPGTGMNMEMENYESDQVRDVMRRELYSLMESGDQFLRDNHGMSTELYPPNVHSFLMEEGWELLFPLGKDEWPPKFRDLAYDEQTTWPHYSMYCYTMDVLCPPSIPRLLLHFGYAVLEGRLVKCAFFVVQKRVDYQPMPQGMVIDPLAVRDGKKPIFYIGCPVDQEDVEHFLTQREHPLEVHVRRRDREEIEERLESSYSEAYAYQIAMAPGWFPPELVSFAKKKGWYVPSQKRKP